MIFSSIQIDRRPLARWKFIVCPLIVSLLLLLLPAIARANAGVSQGFKTTETNLNPGTLMGVTPDRHSAVPAVSNHSYQLLGVIADRPLLALSDGTNQIQITTSGPATVLVSTINGAVKAGDRITASPISGVGMKATDAGQVVGVAQADLASNKTTEQTISDKTGKSQTVQVGNIPLQVSVGYYSGTTDQGKLASVLPPFILTVANNVANKQVSPLRVLIGLLATVFGFAIVANMLQAAIRSSITAMGRNPLAKNILRRELLDVIITAIAILILTAIVIYIILKI